jgi:hypothetical protein
MAVPLPPPDVIFCRLHCTCAALPCPALRNTGTILDRTHASPTRPAERTSVDSLRDHKCRDGFIISPRSVCFNAKQRCRLVVLAELRVPRVQILKPNQILGLCFRSTIWITLRQIISCMCVEIHFPLEKLIVSGFHLSLPSPLPSIS